MRHICRLTFESQVSAKTKFISMAQLQKYKNFQVGNILQLLGYTCYRMQASRLQARILLCGLPVRPLFGSSWLFFSSF